ncbi:uncharacterized protein LOC126377880 isoform X2 [Pectinophora gossypiella]|uniref:uncharacterized protein LOC126377880 isoform X2 n=1 Tax=Pectinophora gossypiella TaxID=13191 RepID=UPI00214E19F0|nr:uncharacterized protein LOC126377880 isoform X2 [Pectinophora gossypiella]
MDVEKASESPPNQDLKKLVSTRGYIKGNLTRLLNTLVENGVESLSSHTLEVRRNRAISTFAEYENVNKEIFYLDPDNSENISECEEKFYSILNIIDIKLSTLTCPQPQVQSSHVVHKSNNSLKLPTIEINPFSGTYSEYVQFIELFKSIIHKDTSFDNLQKLHYLRSFLRNEPYDLIKNLPLVNDSYEVALKILNDRYYNKYKIRNEHVNSLLDLCTVSKASQIRDFVSTIKQNLAALKNLDAKVDEWDPILICIFTRKLDPTTARAFQLERDANVDPTVTKLLEFLEKQALAMENTELASWKPVSQQPVTVNIAPVETKQGCQYCDSTDVTVGAGPAAVQRYLRRGGGGGGAATPVNE